MSKSIARLVLAAVMLLPGTSLVSQSAGDQPDYRTHPYWIDMMQDPKANFFEVQKAFYLYWDNRPTHRGDGYKPFKRWEKYWMPRVNPDGTFPEKGYVAREFNKYVEEHPIDEGFKTASKPWTELGPRTRVDFGGYVGLGRLNAIACDPADTSIVYVGAPSGGLWKTNDGGKNWRPMTDELPSLGVSSILVHPARRNELLVGTGDRDHNDARGIGVIKSNDGGTSWELYNTGMGEVTVGMMARSESDPDLILAATSNGIFKTTDGGNTWVKKSTIGGHYKDIKFKPGNSSIAYSTSVPKSGGDRYGFYRSEDAGETWIRVEEASGVPEYGRMVIGVTPAAPNLVYIVSGAENFVGCFLSDDDGKTFTTRSTTPNILGWNSDGGDNGSQSWYDLAIHVDPVNSLIVHVGGINLWRSVDGGKTWVLTAHWNGSQAQVVHADQHTFFYNPLNRRIYVGNDGGIYYSSDQGSKWVEITEGLGIGQIYRLGVSATNPNKVITGFQDNGSATWIGTEWWTTGGGDGMECAIDPTDYQYSYNTLYYGSIFQNLFNSYQRQVGGKGIGGIDESGPWVTPFLIHEEDGGTMIAGYHNVWITHDLKKQGALTWTKISDKMGGDPGQFINVLEQSPAKLSLLFAARNYATDRQVRELFMTEDFNAGSVVWRDISSFLPSPGYINDIECHPFDQNTVYMALGRRVYKSTDKGETWTDISGSLPNISMNTIAFDKSSTEGLYVGTDAGTYFRDAGMNDWVFYNNGLPNSVEVSELEIYYDHIDRSKSKLSASTFGRGLWETGLSDANPILPPTSLSAVTTSSGINLTWNAPFYPTYVTGYRVYRNHQFYSFSLNPYFLDEQAQKDTDYTYEVAAVYFGTNESALSNSASAILTDAVVLPYATDFNQSTSAWLGNKTDLGWEYGSSFDLDIQGNETFFWGISSMNVTAGKRITGTLASPVIDLSGHLGSQITLRFRSAFRKIGNSEKFMIAYRTSTDGNWTLLSEFGSGDPMAWTWAQTSLVLPQEALVKNAQIAFMYDNNGEAGGGAAVDDIELFVSVAGVPVLQAPENLRIFPNPTSGRVTLAFDLDQPSDIRIRILSIDGRLVEESVQPGFTGSFSKSFDLKGFTKGVYLINIRTDHSEWNEKITLN
jgi:photosystem II stability/assembly factor-like uncharacterized protein